MKYFKVKAYLLPGIKSMKLPLRFLERQNITLVFDKKSKDKILFGEKLIPESDALFKSNLSSESEEDEDYDLLYNIKNNTLKKVY
jgi:hypothetical protein